MSSAGMSKERVTYILAKRYSELGRFVLFSKYVSQKVEIS